MCGIVGVYHYKRHQQNDEGFLNRALISMHHRGPDSSGIWSNQQNYSAGFVRLSIRDLSVNGAQPMLSQCGNYCLSFNGELYNTEKYRERLQTLGVHFKSTTDTEVLLYALVKWGIEEVLQVIDGLFAFAFYDVQRNRLILARDRAGIKPLYIGKGNDGMVYSSQYDHIIDHPYIKDNALNSGAIGAYLSLGYVPENTGVVNSTFMLPHGFYAEVNERGINIFRYFAYPSFAKPRLQNEIGSILDKTVKAQLVSDVPIGTFMSGGVDSPLVSYYAKKYADLKSFNIGVDDDAMDESKAAQSFADIFKTEHYCKHITEQDLLNTIAR